MSGRALITGASGFAGQALRRHLASRGWHCIGAARTPGPGIVACDFAIRSQIESLIAEAGPVTHVFHLAAMTFVPAAQRDPARALEINCNGTVHLVNALRERGVDARFVYVGSSEAYGAPLGLPITEAHPLDPGNPYAISKAAADHYCAYAARREGMDIVRLRPFNHSGPGQSDRFVLSSFARQMAEIEAGLRPPVMRVGNLQPARDFAHVDDVVAAYELAALHGRSGEAYNVCSGAAHRIEEALDILLSLATLRPEVRVDPERARPAEIPVLYGSHDKLSGETGWAPQRGLRDILAGLLEDWRRRVAAASAMETPR